MPGGDGTGPRGLGPRSGRRAGFCAGYPAPGYMNPVPGRGFGFGRGWGRGFRWRQFGYPYALEVAPEEEVAMLKDQVRVLQAEINAINTHIKELESVADKDK